MTTAQGAFQYRVTESFVVQPSDVWVLDNAGDDRLTLTTCHPRYSARERLVVVAELIGPAAPIDPDTGLQEAPGPAELASEDPTETRDESDATAAADDDTAAPATDETDSSDSGATDTDDAATASGPVADGLVSHLDGDRAARGPAIFWGVLAAFVWILTWFVGQRWRRWPSYLMGGLVFLVVLFIFFENFSRLLPPGV